MTPLDYQLVRPIYFLDLIKQGKNEEKALG
jgi:hypothetical protein